MQVLPEEYGGRAALVPVDLAAARRRAAEGHQMAVRAQRRRSVGTRPDEQRHATMCESPSRNRECTHASGLCV